MRLRIKFTKTGQLKYIGHLDVMRYFQKVLRRAGVDVVFSGGFSPHMIMSFALPLGVGITSTGEYFDVDVNDGFDFTGLTRKLNLHTAGDMSVLNVVRVSDKKADKCMTVVDAADYKIDMRESDEIICEAFSAFISQNEIMTVKKTKSGEKLTDIKPMIISCDALENQLFLLKLAAGSRAHLNPQLLIDAFISSLETGAMKDRGFFKRPPIERSEMYALENSEYIPLDRCSGVII